ncbi:MAG: hypothetical protein ACO3GP_05935 [Candidatus Limnocylindrus sp.]
MPLAVVLIFVEPPKKRVSLECWQHHQQEIWHRPDELRMQYLQENRLGQHGHEWIHAIRQYALDEKLR